MLLKTTPLQTDAATLVLRLILGGLMFYHGYLMVEHYYTYMPMMQDILGIGAKLSYNLLIFSQLFCGFLVAIGLFTRLAVLPIMFSMGVAFFIAHKHDSFQVKELALLFLLITIPVFIMGSGAISVDRLFRKK
jgi:putative oxidoreductase